MNSHHPLIHILCVLLSIVAMACAGDDAPNESLGDTPATESNDLGNQCTSNDDCSADTCLFSVDDEGEYADYGYCSGTCESFDNCPDFWSCDTVGNATAKYCVQGN